MPKKVAKVAFTLEGFSLKEGDHVLLTNQRTPRHNGVYELQRVRVPPTRICQLSHKLRKDPHALVAQQAIEAVTVLPVHGLLSPNESRNLVRRIHKQLALYGLSISTVGFKQYKLYSVAELAPKPKTAVRRKKTKKS
jgi:hypothetical protein